MDIAKTRVQSNGYDNQCSLNPQTSRTVVADVFLVTVAIELSPRQCVSMNVKAMFVQTAKAEKGESETIEAMVVRH